MATQPLKNPGDFKLRSGKLNFIISSDRRVMARRWKKLIGMVISERRHHRTKVAKYKESKANCSHCNKEFFKRDGEVNLYCSNDCFNEFRIQIWLPCSICHAAIGIGSQTSGKIIGMGSTSIRRQWKKRGIVSEKKEGRSLVQQGRVMVTASIQKVKEFDCKHEYEKACMADIRLHRASFDWSCLWMSIINNANALANYHSAENIYERESMRNIRTHRSKSIYPDWSIIWTKSRMAMTAPAKVKDNMRNRFRLLMKTAKKGGSVSFSPLIGCTTEQLARHLQSQFKRKMTWENYGTHWHVDHILPVASFDQSNQDHRARCWHWTNLRPLEAQANMDKSDTITEPQMSLTLCMTH